MRYSFNKYGQLTPGSLSAVLGAKARKAEAMAALYPQIREELTDICNELDYASMWLQEQAKRERAA